ncbi:MAG: DegV family EDD domain-containing protein [Chloroherpetonaceae bacterium]|nr:DegV family EDD domain-containing protein [Chloroherpetonaceae bacterium]MDW8437934.1 DegV family protein [Chloroherpetonaceae bacterium]
MPIRYLNGRRLKRGIIAGAESVILRKDYLNRINVFPVADGDTGTNMALTLKAVVDGLSECDDSTIDAVVRCAADAALIGSRGNSGSILAQFYQGLCEGLMGKERATARDFANALLVAKNYAYEAMMTPIEGTILTVIRDWTTAVNELAQITSDFKQIFLESCRAAKESLARTPEQLKINGEAILKKAGVVDSGAQGFVAMVEGVISFIAQGSLKEDVARKAVSLGNAETGNAHADVSHDPLAFQFCTEFVLEHGEGFDKKALRKELLAHGDSLIIGGSSTKTKVHIHANAPQTIFDIAARYGILRKTKFEDMKAQRDQAFGRKPIGILTDSTCDLPDDYLEANDVALVPLSIRFGDEEFLDRVTISPSEFYQRLARSQELPRTSQPSTAHFKQAYDDLLRRYESVVAITLSAGVSGTCQNAKLSSKFFKDRNIVVVDSRLASLGLGFLVREAVEMRNRGESLEAIVRRLNHLATKIKAFLSLETIDNLVRGGRLSRSRGFLAKLLRVNPILSFDERGKVVQRGKGIGARGALNKAIALTIDHVRGKSRAQVGIVYSDNLARAEYAKEKLLTALPNLSVEVAQISPALGVHGGRGCVALIALAE